jgi:mono/diheme cytochrome c family protein
MARMPMTTAVVLIGCLGTALAGTAAGLIALAPAATVWDGVYTDEQATRGQALYEKECATCHLDNLRGEGLAPGLIADAFTYRWQDGPLSDLFIVMKATMPESRPASLTDEEYLDIVAYLLKKNQYPSGQRELGKNPDELKQITFAKPAPAK